MTMSYQSIPVAAGWVLSIVLGIYVLVVGHSAITDPVTYTFDLTTNLTNSSHYQLVIESGILNSNDVDWYLMGNTSVDKKIHSISEGSFDLEDIHNIHKDDDDVKKHGKHSPATSFHCTVTHAAQTVGYKSGSTQHSNANREITIGTVAPQKGFNPAHSALKTKVLQTACPADSADNSAADYTHYPSTFNFVQKPALTKEGKAATGNPKRVNPTCAKSLCESAVLASPGTSGTALSNAVSAGALAMEMIHNSSCDLSELQDHTSSVSSIEYSIRVFAWLLIGVATAINIAHVLRTILCQSELEKDTDVSKKEKLIKFFVFFAECAIPITLATLLFVHLDDLDDELSKDAFIGAPGCNYHVDYSSPSTFRTGVLVIYILLVVSYALAFIPFAMESRQSFYRF